MNDRFDSKQKAKKKTQLKEIKYDRRQFAIEQEKKEKNRVMTDSKWNIVYWRTLSFNGQSI